MRIVTSEMVLGCINSCRWGGHRLQKLCFLRVDGLTYADETFLWAIRAQEVGGFDCNDVSWVGYECVYLLFESPFD